MTSSRIRALLCYSLIASAASFAPTGRFSATPAFRLTSAHLYQSKETTSTTEGEEAPWNPSLRRIMGSVSTLGALETAYLTYTKLAGSTGDLCGTSGDCSSILTGPYSVMPYTDVPVSAVGCGAYLLTFLLSLSPVIWNDSQDTVNRIALLSLTTAMGTFSIWLMVLLWGILHSSCPFCLASASLSLTLAACAWLGGCLPDTSRKAGMQWSMGSMVVTTVLALTLFVNVDDSNAQTNFAGTPTTTSSSEKLAPPAVTTLSSERSLLLSRELQSLNARMYGAYWCSHCYEQKERLGKQAMANIPYVECSKDGVNSQNDLCKEREVPGYPTWEIGGKLFPGEQELDELEDIVKQLKQ